MFTVDQAFNRRNDRVVVPKDEEAPPVMTQSIPRASWCWGQTARRCLHIFPLRPQDQHGGVPEGPQEGSSTLDKGHIPRQDVVWQQDSAPAHGANKTQKWQKTNMPKFWAKEVWPSSSPDLNPLDMPFGRT
ncbi:Uncharacterized protein FKW44_012067 [Caligus rogercresseyi]|uniref:Uncharacterized protein n=1 Tax=Caligus rogercresseyi TaxID=217165 RepID=A0A7T8HJ64_CALRO|nr:Uncharacterized protein FKW44_012067 [Caligus rogercresseyi]